VFSQPLLLSSGIVNIAVYFGSQEPQTVIFNRRFKPNVQNIKTKITETTEPIRAKFCTTINTIKYPLQVVENRAQKSKMANGHNPEKKSITRHISATV